MYADRVEQATQTPRHPVPRARVPRQVGLNGPKFRCGPRPVRSNDPLFCYLAPSYKSMFCDETDITEDKPGSQDKNPHEPDRLPYRAYLEHSSTRALGEKTTIPEVVT